MGKVINTLVALAFLSPFTSQAVNKYVYRLNSEESASITNVNYGVGRGRIYDFLYMPGTIAGNLVFYKGAGMNILNSDSAKKNEIASEAFRKIDKKLGIQ